MAIINRVSRLFRADFNAVLDRMEEPEIMLRQAIREMEEDLERSQQKIRSLTWEREDAARRCKELDQRLAELEKQLDLCFSSGKDDLARTLIRKKLEASQLLASLDHTSEQLETEIVKLQSVVHERISSLDRMRQKAEILSPEAESDNVTHVSNPPVIDDHAVEVAFLQEKSMRAAS